MGRMILLSLLLLFQPAAAQSIKERIEAEATERVGGMLSLAVETTLVTEGRAAEYAQCVGQFVAKSFKGATDDQRERGMRSWIDNGKRRCELSG